MKLKVAHFVLQAGVFILMGLLVLLPVSVQAAHKVWALVPVLPPEVSAKDANSLYQSLKDELTQKHKTTLVDDQLLFDYFNQEAESAGQDSEGDELFIEAKQSYLQFDNRKAEKLLASAIEKYQENPGSKGGAYQAYLLLATIESDKGQSGKAKKHTETAISHNLDATDLTDAFFSPRFRQTYKVVRDEYLKTHPGVPVTVQLSSNDKTPIFANGVAVGSGPQVTLQALPDQILFLQAGVQGKLYRTKPNAERANKIRIRSKLSKSKVSDGLAFGFSNNTPHLTQESQWLGKKVGATQVVLMSYQKQSNVNSVNLSVVDMAKGKITEAKNFEMSNFKKDADQVSVLMAQYLMSLAKNDFKEAPEDEESLPVLVGQKKVSPWVWVAAGTLLAGAVTGAVLLTTSSTTTDSDSNIDVELPPGIGE